MILRYIQVTGNRVAAGGVPVSPGHELHVAMALGPGHHVVLLAALAAESQGKEGLVRVVRDSQLIVAGQVPSSVGSSEA